MTFSRQVVALIPARGGSKGIPRKNLQLLGGEPLIYWSINQAKKVEAIKRIFVSSDSTEICEVARSYHAETLVRPAKLATDKTLIVEVIEDFIRVVTEKIKDLSHIILLEPTAPLRRNNLIERCIDRVFEEDLDSLATFKAAETIPNKVWRIDNGVPIPYLENSNVWDQRQSMPNFYQLDGRVYIFRPEGLMQNGSSLLFGKVGAEITNDFTIDINNSQDLEVANAMVSRNRELLG